MVDFIQDNSIDFAELAKQKIAEFNARHWDASQRQALGLKRLNANGEVVAALAGRTFGNWFNLETLWLAESDRNNGIGTLMLAQAERIAKARGCRFVLLDTLNFQARPFYERLGYQLQWQQHDYPVSGGAKYFLVKNL